MKQPATPVAVEYPSSDGKPMAESHRHAIATVNAWQGLGYYFTERADVYVGMDMLMYFVEGDPRQSVVPDVFVVVGVPKLPLRDNWLVWQEGRAPDFVLEVTSRTTRREDEGRKRLLYQRLGVSEYWQYDPTGDYLDPVLKGARLVDGFYRPIATTFGPDGAPRLASALGLELHVVRGGLRLFDPSRGRHLPVFEEETVRADAAEHRAETAEHQAEEAKRYAAAVERHMAAVERHIATVQRQVAAAERQVAAAERQLAAAERETAAAKSETATAKRRADEAEGRAAALEAQLRASRQ